MMSHRRTTLLSLLAAFLLALPTADAARHKKHPAAANAAPSPGARGAIHGTVRAGIRPMSHIAVHLLHKNRTCRTNNAGHFSFKNLKPGVYTLVVHTRRHGFARASLAIDPGQSSDLILALRHPRPHHLRRGGTATPGHTPGHVAGLS